MPKYKVILDTTDFALTTTLEVDADDEDQAEATAREQVLADKALWEICDLVDEQITVAHIEVVDDDT